MSLWLFIWRFNPPHIWHTSIIDKALKENEKVLLLIWIWENRDDRNPLVFDEIKSIFDEKYKNINNLNIDFIKDVPSDEEWVQKIKEIIEKYYPWVKDINFYWWDFENDSAFNAINKYKENLNNYNINYIEKDRSLSFVEDDEWIHTITATNLRKALREWNIELARMFMDEEMKDKIEFYFLK